MMESTTTTTVTLRCGVGLHALYDIVRNGERVAYMSRYSYRWPWEVSSVHYGHKLFAGSKDIDTARQRAITFEHYPTEQEVYEAICADTEPKRRDYKERRHAHDFARLARELVAGSNSARQEIEDLVRAIETYATDRGGTRAAAMEAAERHFEATGERVFPAEEPYYPAAPVSAEQRSATG